MAVEKTINIKVNTNSADAELGKLEQSFKDVDKAAEKTSKSVDDVAGNGGAIAILDQLTGGLATRLKDAFEASKLFNTSLKATRGALIATGIGAFVVALGLVVAYWDDIVEFIGGANKKLQKQIDLGNEKVGVLQSELDLLAIQKTTYENLGESTDEINQTIKETLETQLLQAEANLELLRTQLEIENSKAIEFTLWEKIQLGAGGLLGQAQLITEEEVNRNKELREGIATQEQGIASIRLKQSEAVKQDREERKQVADEKYAQFLKENDLAIKKLEAEQAQIEKDKADRAEFQELLDEEEQEAIDREDRRLEFLEESLSKEQEIRDKAAKEKLEAEKTVQDVLLETKMLEVDNISGIVSLIASLGKESKALQVAAIIAEAGGSIAKTIISTQAANAAITAEGLALSIPTAGASVAAAAALVSANTVSSGISVGLQAAAAAQGISALGGGGSVSKGSGGSGGGGVSAPSFNLVQGTGQNQIAEGLAGQNQPIQAFVVSSDVSTSQSLDRNIVENSSL